jgi:hypothetical protein
MATLVRNAFIAEAKQAEHFSVIAADFISHVDHVSEDYFQKYVLNSFTTKGSIKVSGQCPYFILRIFMDQTPLWALLHRLQANIP